MTVNKLTPKQLTDILFQTPNRITVGVLEKQSLFEKTRNSVFSYHRKSARTAGILNTLREKLLLVFDENSSVSQEHPRSLKKAAYELKAIGYSNAQINKIKNEIGVFVATYIDRSKLGYAIYKDYPNLGAVICDNAFLGIAGYDKKRNRSGASAIEFFKEIKPTYNSIFTERTEPMAYEYLSRYIEGLTTESHPELLIPARPSKIFRETITPSL